LLGYYSVFDRVVLLAENDVFHHILESVTVLLGERNCTVGIAALYLRLNQHVFTVGFPGIGCGLLRAELINIVISSKAENIFRLPVQTVFKVEFVYLRVLEAFVVSVLFNDRLTRRWRVLDFYSGEEAYDLDEYGHHEQIIEGDDVAEPVVHLPEVLIWARLLFFFIRADNKDQICSWDDF
jgi:hypothetical protein